MVRDYNELEELREQLGRAKKRFHRAQDEAQELGVLYHKARQVYIHELLRVTDGTGIDIR